MGKLDDEALSDAPLIPSSAQAPRLKMGMGDLQSEFQGDGSE